MEVSGGGLKWKRFQVRRFTVEEIEGGKGSDG